MIFNEHYDLEGQHAFLSASRYHWINYDDEKLSNAYHKFLATSHGTRLHEFAKECISLGQKLPRTKQTLNLYVNDAIGFKMSPEVVLVYSRNCFGTADAIGFRKNHLRIHDLKTGATPAYIKQLEIYAGLFCLEYNIDPENITTDLRIYQFDQYIEKRLPPEETRDIMNKIVHSDRRIELIQFGG